MAIVVLSTHERVTAGRRSIRIIEKNKTQSREDDGN